MVNPPRDTDANSWAIVDAGLRSMTPAEKISRVAALTELAHAFALAHIRQQYPNEDRQSHRLRLASRWLDASTMEAAFGWRSTD